MTRDRADRLYFAYGSNLDPAGMQHRCPAATPAGRASLAGWRLTFRGVADVEPADGQTVEGLLWHCTNECIASLDIYEGVRGGYYRKERLDVRREDGTTVRALVYVMNPDRLDNMSMPSVGYLETIVRGYEAFGLPREALEDALRYAEDRCNRKGVREWAHDGRKRMRPADRPGRRAQGPKKVRKSPSMRITNIADLTDEQAAAMGISPATLAMFRADARELGEKAS